MNSRLPLDDVLTNCAFSTASPRIRRSLWEAGDSGGRAAAPLTCGDVGFSTIHSTYYGC